MGVPSLWWCTSRAPSVTSRDALSAMRAPRSSALHTPALTPRVWHDADRHLNGKKAHSRHCREVGATCYRHTFDYRRLSAGRQLRIRAAAMRGRARARSARCSVDALTRAPSIAQSHSTSSAASSCRVSVTVAARTLRLPPRAAIARVMTQSHCARECVMTRMREWLARRRRPRNPSAQRRTDNARRRYRSICRRPSLRQWRGCARTSA